MRPAVLLIHPLYGDETNQRDFHPGVELPISLAYLSAYLEQQGFSSNILDLRLEPRPLDAMARQLTAIRPLAVGITASTAAIQLAAQAASQLKSLAPQVSTIVGGWHASALPEETLRQFPQFDYAIHGEGERALTHLVQVLEGGGEMAAVRGVAYRSGKDVVINPRGELIECLDKLPFPSREKTPIQLYQPSRGTRNYLRLPSTGILVGRGCPYQCRFCYKGVWGRTIRFRSPENVLEEIEQCIDQFGIRDFRFYDDTVTFSAWNLEGFCNEIIRRRLDISWNCWSRVNDVNEAKLRLMKAAGCYHIKFGIEFGTEKALKLARKAATLEQAREAIRITRRVGMECKGSFIFGIPGETEEDCRRTIAFAISIAPDFATFYPFDPIPGSVFHDLMVRGEIKPEVDMLPREVTNRLAKEAYHQFYLRAGFAKQRLWAMMRHPIREAQAVASGGFMLARSRVRQCARALVTHQKH